MSSTRDSELLRVLRERQAETGGEGSPSPETIRDEWIDAVSGLLDTISEWLDGARSEGLVSLARSALELSEARLGTYPTEQLVLEMPPDDVVVVRPVGRSIIGGSGRVDVVAGPRNVMLVRRDTEWCVAERTPRVQFTPLDREEFERVLLDLTQRG